MKAKAREEAEKRMMLEYIQQLWNKMLAEDVTLLKGAEKSQIIGSKCKKVSLRDNVNHQPSKKTKEKKLAKYCGDIGIKIERTNLCEKCLCAR